MRLASAARIGLSGTSSNSTPGAAGTRAGAAAAPVRAASTSRRRGRPRGPEPWSRRRSTPACAAIFRASGEAFTRPARGIGATPTAGTTGAAAAGRGALAGGAAGAAGGGGGGVRGGGGCCRPRGPPPPPRPRRRQHRGDVLARLGDDGDQRPDGRLLPRRHQDLPQHAAAERLHLDV